MATRRQAAAAKTEIPGWKISGHVQITGQRKEEDVSGAVARRADASINKGSAACGIAASASPRWVGPHAVVATF